MFVVAEASSVSGEGAGEGFFSRVAEGGMSEVVTQSYGLGQVFVEAEGAGYSPCDLHHLERMGQAGTVVVTVGGDKDLGLVHKAAEGFGVGNTVPVALELVSDAVRGLEPRAAGATLASPLGGSRLVTAGLARGIHAGRRRVSVSRGPRRALPGAWAR